jgi:two-component system, NtrC family, sensor kinase
MGPWNRHSGSPRQVDLLIDVLRVACGLGVILVGGYHLAVGIVVGRDFLGILADDLVMAPITASCLLCMGISLLLITGPHRARWQSGLAIVCSGVVAMASALRLFKLLTAWLGVLELASPPPLPQWVIMAGSGPMDPFTALALLLASLTALVRIGIRRLLKVDWVGLGGLMVAVAGGVFVLGNFYATLPFYEDSIIPMAPGTGLGFSLLGLGLIATAGSKGSLIRPVLGQSVKARLLRSFLPYAVLIVIGSDSLTLLSAQFSSPSSSALTSAISVAAATAVAVAMCALIAGHLGSRLERAESELRTANELLETRVEDRTRDLEEARRELEVKNQELQQSADELACTAATVQRAHQQLQIAHEDLKRAETHLIQSEKLSSLGQLVAGVAHEVNNPLAYVSNNIAILERDVVQLRELICLYQHAEDSLEQDRAERLASIRLLAEQIDLDYVLEHLPSMVGRSREGLRRIQQIIGNLRDFARLDEAEIKEVDLNLGIMSTLEILRGMAREQDITLVDDLKPLPLITCYPAKINQVLLNLVCNAIEASDRGSSVTVSTQPKQEGGVDLIVEDLGHGIEPSIRGKIFDPFFTTKPIGKGKGLGLSISYGIVQAHGGTIQVQTELGRGSRFIVHLQDHPPLESRQESLGPSLTSSNSLTTSGLGGENDRVPQAISRPVLEVDPS